MKFQILGETKEDQIIIENLITKHKLDPTKITNTESIKNMLYLEGYFNFELTQKITNDSITNLKIKTNNPVKVLRIDKAQFNSELLDYLQPKAYLKSDTKNIYISVQSIETFIKAINSFYSSIGYPFNQIQLKPKKNFNDTITANIEIIKNTNRIINNIYIKDYNEFPKGFLKYHLKLNKEKNLDIKELKKIDNLLSEIDFIKIIKPSDMLFTEESSEIYLYISKENTNEFDGFLGFSNKNNKINLSGNVKIKLKNNFNYGETFFVKYINDESEQETFETNIITPYLFKLPLEAEYNLNYFRKDSTFTNTNQNFRLKYILKSNLKLGVEYDDIKSNSTLEIENQEDFSSKFYGISFYKNSPNNRFNSKNKFLFETKIKTGDRITKQNSSNQFIVEVNIEKKFPINLRSSFNIRSQIKHLASKDYLENELYRIGGVNTIRGFEENSILTNSYFLLNTEYHYKINTTLTTYPLIDLAHIENKLQKTQQNLYAIGLGIVITNKKYKLNLNYSTGRYYNKNNLNNKGKVSIIFSTSI